VAIEALAGQNDAFDGVIAINLLPINLYGPGDNFDPDSSHVISRSFASVSPHTTLARNRSRSGADGSASSEFPYVDFERGNDPPAEKTWPPVTRTRRDARSTDTRVSSSPIRRAQYSRPWKPN
jgi:hypothetical protein